MKRRFWHVGRRSLPKIALAENRRRFASNFVSFRFDAPDVPHGIEDDGAVAPRRRATMNWLPMLTGLGKRNPIPLGLISEHSTRSSSPTIVSLNGRISMKPLAGWRSWRRVSDRSMLGDRGFSSVAGLARRRDCFEEISS